MRVSGWLTPRFGIEVAQPNSARSRDRFGASHRNWCNDQFAKSRNCKGLPDRWCAGSSPLPLRVR